MFLIFKKKTLLYFFIFILLIGLILASFFTVNASSPKPFKTIVIDAGHGARDAGCIGKYTGVKESDLNLAYAKTLKKIFEDVNIKVIMTRADDKGLYNPAANNKKKSEMEKRKSVIEKSNADIVISVHMNSYPLSSSRGAQVFYGLNNLQGENLAKEVQSAILKTFPDARKNSSVGDYFILNCTPLPAILIEFGFLSNKEEELLLQTNEYREKICYAVLAGVLNYVK